MSLPDPLNQNLHFSRILRPHVCTLKFESTGVLNITDFASLAIMAPSFVSNTLILFSWDALPSLACEKDRVGLSTGIFLILAKGSEHSTWVQQIKFCLLHVWHKYQKWLKVLIPNTVQKKKKALLIRSHSAGLSWFLPIPGPGFSFDSASLIMCVFALVNQGWVLWLTHRQPWQIPPGEMLQGTNSIMWSWLSHAR